ncbi:MAG: glucosyl-3-phosphoglycerate phosphatase [Sphingomonadales bacterium]|jgi:probable phosphoglycerate mutase|nr:glucosyl-3-phosphoglycerate phosphatase [Sphingomonadales bacterium]
MARWFIARHGETVFNAARRMQGEVLHTPLTRAGFRHAEEIGEALLAELGPAPPLTLWASPTGRALQTLAVVAEHLRLDWHSARTDERLSEMDMGDWSGRYYAEIAESHGGFVDPKAGLFTCRPPGGEWYDDIARRLAEWVADTGAEAGDRLIVMHGISSRVLRGLLIGAPERPGCGAPVAAPLPQGSVVCVEDGIETVVGLGSGELGASGTA